MSEQTSPDTSPFSRGGRREDDNAMQGPPGRMKDRRGRGHFTPCDCVMTCCSKLAVLPSLHSAVMSIIGANTELPLHHYCCRLCRVITLREVTPVNYANSLHHMHRFLLWVQLRGCITLHTRRFPVYTYTTQSSVVYMYTTKQIKLNYHMSICQPSMMDLPANVMQTVDFTVWELALLYIKVQFWSFQFFYFFYPLKKITLTLSLSSTNVFYRWCFNLSLTMHRCFCASFHG